MDELISLDIDMSHPDAVRAAAPSDMITDGEFVCFIVTASPEERMMLLRRMVLRHFAEVSGLLNTAFALHSDRDAWHRIAKTLAVCRDASMAMIANQPTAQETADAQAQAAQQARA